MALLGRSDLDGSYIGGSSAAQVANTTSSGNGFIDWLKRKGTEFMNMQTRQSQDSMRGAYNFTQAINGNPVPMTNSINEAFGSDPSDYGNDSSTPDASLDVSGYDQAQWEFEKQMELLAEQRAFNSAEAEKNRQWQERLSNTAYQRAVEDLEKAGLNKWLAVTGGNGASASTPSGSSATSSAGDASAPNPQIYKAILDLIGKVTTSVIKLVDFL